MNVYQTKNLSLSAFFIAIGLILPIATHSIGASTMLLPMHLTVILAACILPLHFSILVGSLTPILSTLITGMPPLFPVLPFMFFELITYAIVVNILYFQMKKNIYIALIISMIIGRFISGIIVWILTTIFMAQLPNPIFFIATGVIQGIPGILIQLVFIPSILYGLKKSLLV